MTATSGAMRRYAGDLDGATEALDEAQQLQAKLGFKYGFAGQTELFFAAVALDRGDTKGAVAHLLHGHDVVRPLVEDHPDMWEATDKPLLEWARVAVAYGEYEVGVTLLAANELFYSESIWPGFPLYLADVERTLTAAKEQLDPDRFEAAWNGGLQMTSIEALDYAVDTLATGSA